MKKELFGLAKDGQEIYLYTFENLQGMKMTVSNIGAELINLWVPDKEGVLRDVVLGFDSVAGYEGNDDSYLGATVGRSANRLANARFELSGKTYTLATNDGENNLHSGPNGYQIRIWEEKEIDLENNKITFSLISPDGDQGYPGELKLSVTYQLTENAVSIRYQGISDQETLFNPTNHSYFNLNGHQSGSILNHQLKLAASHFTPMKDSHSIPTGEIQSVEGTPMDFREGKLIGTEIETDYDQLLYASGYDHNFVLDNPADFAELIGDESKIVMKAATNLPGVQFYSGNYLNEASGKAGMNYEKRAGLCLETQYFPNAVNEPNFKTPLLEKDQLIEYWTTYSFSIA